MSVVGAAFEEWVEVFIGRYDAEALADLVSIFTAAAEGDQRSLGFMDGGGHHPLLARLEISASEFDGVMLDVLEEVRNAY